MNANLAQTPTDEGRDLIIRLNKAVDELALVVDDIETMLGGSIPIPPRPKREIVGQLCGGITELTKATDTLMNEYA